MKRAMKVYLFIGRDANELKDISKRYCIQFGYFSFTDISDNHKIVRDFLIESKLDIDYDNIFVVDVLSNAVRLAAIID